MYGKLINNSLIYSPAYIISGNQTIYNPDPETLVSHSWLPIIATPMPNNEEKSYEPSWQEVDNQIVQVWDEYTPISTPHIPTLEERMVIVEDAVVELAKIVSETN